MKKKRKVTFVRHAEEVNKTGRVLSCKVKSDSSRPELLCPGTASLSIVAEMSWLSTAEAPIICSSQHSTETANYCMETGA